MKLSEVPSGASVFIDANIFIYHFTGVSLECKEFLSRCVQGQWIAITSTTILAEVCHRLMTIEAIAKGLVKAKQSASDLKGKLSVAKKLSEYYTQVTNILSWPIKVLDCRPEMLIKSQIYRQRFGLLTNDSLIPVYMEGAGTLHLASSDSAFRSFPELHVYSPSDLDS